MTITHADMMSKFKDKSIEAIKKIAHNLFFHIQFNANNRNIQKPAHTKPTNCYKQVGI